MSWRTEAACKGQPTEWFYSTKYAARALIVCNDCPVRRPCNQEAEQAGEEFGEQFLGAGGRDHRCPPASQHAG